MPESSQEFFENPNANSIIKAEIVSKYFDAWSKIISRQNFVKQLNYIDLYSGTGAYENGQKSTPLLILETAISDPIIKEKLNAVFNDGNSSNVKKLKLAISSLPGIENLSRQPKIHNTKIGLNDGEQLKQVKMHPTFSFIDPFGYKGLTRALISNLLKDWGCDVVFFFNYNRLKAVNNPKIEEHINRIFGEDNANYLRSEVGFLSAAKREILIMKTLYKSLNEIGAQFIIPFKFYSPKKMMTSHFLIFVTKNETGYTVMKEIMSKYKNRINLKIRCFEYNIHLENQAQLFNTEAESLEYILQKKFANKKISAKQIYNTHINTPFIRSDYRNALLALEEKRFISITPPADKRRKYNGRPSIADKVIVEFL